MAPQPSRKGKKAWRKNIDIADVEESLEELRKEEMAGGSRLAEQTNEQLFTVDTVGDRETKRKLASKKKLRIDEILEERSAIPAVRARVVAAAASAAATTAASKKRKAPTGAKQAMKKAKTAERVVREVPVKPLDIWDDSDALKTVSVVPAGIDPVTAEYLEPLFVKPVKKPETMVKPKIASALPAIAVAHPGASYNPMIYDHQDAILLAVNEELERLQKVAALDAQVPSKDVLVSTQNLGADVTMTVDLDSEDESEDEELEVDTDGNVIPSAVNGAKKNKKKTKAQLNRAMKQRKLEEEIARQKEQRRVENEVLLYKKLKKENEMTDEQGMADAEERRRRKEQAELQRPPRASKHMYRQLPTAVKLTEELTDSLRQLQPEGSVVKDLFNSLQKRGVIETRIPTAQRRRYKLKEYEKHSYKKFQ